MKLMEASLEVIDREEIWGSYKKKVFALIFVCFGFETAKLYWHKLRW